MSWKKWPYWLRGGIIAAVIVILTLLIFWWCVEHTKGDSAIGCLAYIYPIVFPYIMLQDLLDIIFDNHDFLDLFPSVTIFILASIGFWFVFGALIGLIFDYRKAVRDIVAKK